MSIHIVAGTLVAVGTIGTITYNAKKIGEAARMVAVPYRWLRALVMTPTAVIKLADTQASHGRALEKIVKELTPNGGLSLRDAVGRIESNSIADRQRNRALLLEIPDGVFEADQAGNFTWVNRTLCRLMQRLPDEILGRGWESCIPIEEREKVLCEWNRCVSAGREFVMELKFAKPVNIHSYVLRGEGGQVIGFQGICRRIET